MGNLVTPSELPRHVQSVPHIGKNHKLSTGTCRDALALYTPQCSLYLRGDVRRPRS